MTGTLWNSDSTALFDDYRMGALLFEKPCGSVEARSPDEVARALLALETAQKAGLYAVGFFSYELGYGLEPKLAPLLPAARAVPLLSFGLFEKAVVIEPDRVEAVLASRATKEDFAISDPHPLWDLAAYRARFEAVRSLIGAGDAYQVNLTFPLYCRVEGSHARLFAALRKRARARHGAYLALNGLSILSLSPELFIETEGKRIITRPMKATAPRAPTLAADETMRRALAADRKSRAENLMIVDLLRNDLGRIGKIGSVKVEDLFTVETYPTLHTLTSTVSAERAENIDLAGILRALFPSGSVTGAPKIRAMEIIRALEPAPRGVYCGAIGYLGPEGAIKLNVSIRTLSIDAGGRGTLGIGGGLLFDSKLASEYDECLLKAQFLTHPAPDFSLIETFAWTRAGGYTLMEEHLARLTESARYFAYPCAEEQVRAALEAAATQFQADALRVRLTLSERGEIEITHAPMPPATLFKAMLSARPVSSTDPFLYHKTTSRDFYDAELKRLCGDGVDEVLFVNERGELTEGTRTNIFLQRGPVLLTPPLAAGLLPGTFRARLIAEGHAREAILFPGDLKPESGALYLGNALRGLVPTQFLGVEQASPPLKRVPAP